VVEIDPVSVVIENGFIYRSTWNRGADAVSAVFMRSEMHGEYVLDEATASKSDWVVTFPTRQHYLAAQSASPPFTRPALWAADCGAIGADGSRALPQTLWRGEQVLGVAYNRAQAAVHFNLESDFGAPQPPPLMLCAAASVFSFASSAARFRAGKPSVLGSQTGGLSVGRLDTRRPDENGWARLTVAGRAALVSLPTSTRTRIATGIVTGGAHTFTGLPVTGFMVRTFENGTLTCSSGACQGNYGGSFPLSYRRSIAPAD
jgi:hypothetical protein